MSDPWIIGQVARVSVVLTDANAAAADPSALALKIKPPTGAVVTYAYGGGVLLKDAVGAYHADITLDQAGAWNFRWEATAPNAGAFEHSVAVQKSRVL